MNWLVDKAQLNRGKGSQRDEEKQNVAYIDDYQNEKSHPSQKQEEEKPRAVY